MLQSTHIKIIGILIIFLIGIFSLAFFANKSNSNMKKVEQAQQEKIIRKMAVAGQFYPKEIQELDKGLSIYLANSTKIDVKEKLRILVVPHAGTRFSGQTAAQGFKQLESEHYKRVIVLGVGHQSQINHAAVISKGEWETPYGNIPIDEDLANQLINGFDILHNTIPHQKEHSIEMTTIFLKKVLDDFSLVPILLSQTNDNLINNLAYRISNQIDDETLLVISTDLSHYPSWKDAQAADQNTIEAILTGNKQNFEAAVKENLKSGYSNLSTSACGYEPLRVGLKIAELMGFSTIKEFDYKNSGDITGDKTRVVGYTSIGFYSEKIKAIKLSEQEKVEALKLARNTIESLFSTQTPAEPKNDDLNQPIGAFVTLTKNNQLRGCIGQFEPNKPLKDVIKDVAASAAIKDPRFTPITKDELEDIEIEISTMSPQILIKNWQDIKLGTHGVRIIYKNKSGTLLPQVATDNNWNLVTFLEQICEQKMGINKDCYKDTQAEIYIYETNIFSEQDY